MVTETQILGLGEFTHWSFTLEHDGAMTVFLLHEGKLVGRFSQTGATEKSIQRECALHLTKCHGWEGRLWSRKEANEG